MVDEQITLQDAASAGLKSMEQLIRLVSHHNLVVDCRELTDSTVSEFRKAITTMNRTGHARFRRGPVQSLQQQNQIQSHRSLLSSSSSFPSSQIQFNVAHAPVNPPPAPVSSSPSPTLTYHPQSLTLDFTKPNLVAPKHSTQLDSKMKAGELVVTKDSFTTSPPLSTSMNSSSFVSSITGEGSVSNGKQASSLFLAPAPATVSAGKPPVSVKRCREHDHSVSVSGRSSVSGRCHCKKRYKFQ